MQLLAFQCLLQVVVGFNKVVHADMAISGACKLFRRLFEHAHLFGLWWQPRLFQYALPIIYIRYVRIAKSNQSVGPHVYCACNGACKALHRLPRQAVYEVEINLCTALPKPLNDVLYGQQRGSAVHGSQHVFVKILYSQAVTRKPAAD